MFLFPSDLCSRSQCLFKVKEVLHRVKVAAVTRLQSTKTRISFLPNGRNPAQQPEWSFTDCAWPHLSLMVPFHFLYFEYSMSKCYAVGKKGFFLSTHTVPHPTLLQAVSTVNFLCNPRHDSPSNRKWTQRLPVGRGKRKLQGYGGEPDILRRREKEKGTPLLLPWHHLVQMEPYRVQAIAPLSHCCCFTPSCHRYVLYSSRSSVSHSSKTDSHSYSLRNLKSDRS